MLGKVLRVIKGANAKNVQAFEALKTLKGESVFDTFCNVKLSNSLDKVRKEVKSLKRNFANPKGLSKEERKSISKERKIINNNLRRPYYYAIGMVKSLPREKQGIAINEIRQNIFRQKLKLKQEEGKTISTLDTLRFHSPKIRDAEGFLKTRIYASGMMNLFNINDITDANDKLGTGAAAEEVMKTTAMCFVGLSMLKYANIQLKNIVTTTSIYCPGGRFLKGMSFPLAILSSVMVKPIMDKCWETEYEKIKK